MSLMTLDEAIQHCLDKENCSQCGQEHRQLREWLEELKELRSRYNIPTPHGRLIDADLLLAIMRKRLYGNPEFDYIIGLVERQRTIIEAEDIK